MFLENKHIVSLIICVLFSYTVVAQVDDDVIFNPYPETGAWFEPDNPGSGFFIEVQGGVVSGAYFGYENDGGNAWLLFNNELTVAINAGPDFESFVTPLTQSMDGECIINCSAPSSNDDRFIEEVASLQMQFVSQAEATFSIDGGPVRTIRPLTYGNEAQAVFPQFPDVLLPIMTGDWLLRVVLSGSNIDQQSLAVKIGEQSIVMDGDMMTVRYPVMRSIFQVDDFFTMSTQVLLSSEPRLEQIGEFRCVAESTVICVLDVCEFFTPGLCGPVPFGSPRNAFGISFQNDHRFISTGSIDVDPPTGLIAVQGFRMDYD